MEPALRSLRQLSAGIGHEAAVFRAAARVPAAERESRPEVRSIPEPVVQAPGYGTG